MWMASQKDWKASCGSDSGSGGSSGGSSESVVTV